MASRPKSRTHTNAKADERRWYEFRAAAEGEPETAELHIFGPIGGGFFSDPDAPSGKRIAQQLEQLPDSVKTIRVLVNSPGGNVFDGTHIANALRRQREELGRAVVVEVEALAASAATVVTAAGNPIRMPRNALMMIHNPWVGAAADAQGMRKLADILDRVKKTIVATYQWVSKLPEKKLAELMDEVTWMNADEALANGFVTEITRAVQASASLDPQFLNHLEIPEQYRDQVMAMLDSAGEEPDGEPDTDDEPPPDEGRDDEPEDEPMAKSTDQNPTPAPDAGETQANATREERERVVGIDAAVETAIKAGLDPAKAAETRKKAIADGVAAEAVREQLLNDLAARSDSLAPSPNGGHLPITGGEDERDKRIVGMQAALWRRAGVTAAIQKAAKDHDDHALFQGLETDPGEFRGLTLYDFCREDLERGRPGCTRGRTRMQVVGDFFASAGGHQSTSDFAVALENALHKTLVAAYMTTPDTWRRFCATGQVSDFRPHDRHKTGFLARLSKVLESGEFRRQQIPDTEKESTQAETFGDIIGLTRQAIINDDMSVFSRIAMWLGRASALTIEVEVYALLALNGGLGPNMKDGNPLFDAAHNNLGAGAAIDFASIEADSVVLAKQTDPSGNEILDLKPSVLVVPIGLRGTALQINRAEFEDHNRGKPNRVLGLFEDVVGTARLTGTRRYMFADPSVAPCLEVSFLEGEQEPFMEMKDGWNIDGVEWKVRHDIATAAVDFRSAVTNAGA